MEISSLQKKLIVLISILTIFMGAISFSLYRGIQVNPEKLQVHYKTLQSEKIPETLNDLSILYFTDLQYGKFQDTKRCKKLFDKINHLSPDVVLFGGDVYDQSTKASEDSIKFLSKLFSSIDAPYGKFAVLGEKDILNETKTNAVNRIFDASDFEILKDSNVKLSKQDGKSIRLIGLTPEANLKQAFNTTSSKEYNLLISHYPDTLVNEALATAPISLAIAGHSHCTQVSYPIIGGYKKDPHAQLINRNQSKRLSFPYLISTGTGCTKVNMRLLSTPEVYYFILKH